jgi:hypothetical protein
MTRNASKYSMILRLWCADQSDSACWRASLENPETGKRIGFASLEQLFVHLIDITERGSDFDAMDNVLGESQGHPGDPQ